MSNELLGEWLTYASFAVPGMFCFVGAVWVDWRDKASPYRVTDDTAASKIASKEKMVDVYPKSVLTIIATELVVLADSNVTHPALAQSVSRGCRYAMSKTVRG
jgi:hypothetical protein